MAESAQGSKTGSSSSSSPRPSDEFGANEWLVDEMYERYKQDPDSVDKAWWDFFRSRDGGSGDSEATSNGAQKTEQKTRAEDRAEGCSEA